MNAVGDRVDPIAGKHVPRRLGVAARDAVDIAGQIERELRHVERVAPGEALEFIELD